MLRIESGKDVIQQVDDYERDATADSGSDQTPGLLVVPSKRIENDGASECERDSRRSYGADEDVLQEQAASGPKAVRQSRPGTEPEETMPLRWRALRKAFLRWVCSSFPPIML